MKKTLSLLLALVLCLYLCACGGSNDMSETAEDNSLLAKEKLLELAINLDNDEELYNLVASTYVTGAPSGDGIGVYALELLTSQNRAKFVKNYIDNISIISGVVVKIEKDYCLLGYKMNGGSPAHNGGIRVYLDLDELAELTLLNTITVVGTLIEDEGNECVAIIENGHRVYYGELG